MSETKFTPGPWRYNVSTNGEVVAVNARGLDTTVVESDAANPWNSWLIAAAPELYEAMDLALTDCHVCGNVTPETCNLFEKVMAKARGGNK